jgi:hypothetical protein
MKVLSFVDVKIQSASGVLSAICYNQNLKTCHIQSYKSAGGGWKGKSQFSRKFKFSRKSSTHFYFGKKIRENHIALPVLAKIFAESSNCCEKQHIFSSCRAHFRHDFSRRKSNSHVIKYVHIKGPFMSHIADKFSLFCNKLYGKIYIWCFSRNFS